MLYENEFDKIWDNIVKPLIVQHSQSMGVSYKSLSLTKRRLKRKYDKYKDNLVRNYMVLDTFNIDRHKIAACMMKAILSIKPLYIPFCARLRLLFSSKEEYFNTILKANIQSSDDDENTPKKFYLFLNEYLSMGVVISILDSYIQSSLVAEKFVHNIVLPKPFPEPDVDYLLDVCIGLHYTPSKNINPIAYANAFFLWEKYSCRKKQCDNIIEAYKNSLKKSGVENEKDIDNEVHRALFGK